MEPNEDLLIPYWLRTVRIGLVVTLLALVALVIPPFLPGHGLYRTAPYFAVLVLAALGGLMVRSLPWKRLFDQGIGLRFMYGWSAADILLISYAIGITGGGRSDLFPMYGLTTVFFGASYPQRGQAVLLGFTFGCYLTVLGVSGWDVSSLSLFVHLTSLAILALLTSFLSRELMGQMTAHQRARSNSERWASLLSAVAAAAQSMPLDSERVVDVALDAIIQMGFDGASMNVVDEGGATYRVL